MLNPAKLESLDEVGRASVTIGLSPSGYTSIDATKDPSAPELLPKEHTSSIMAEYKNARDALKATGQLPIAIDNKCLMSMQDGRDTSIVLKLFKTACLSYAPSDVSYRDHQMSRAQLL